MRTANLSSAGFSWLSIVRIGLVQASIGAMVMLTTSLLNRLMVVEYALAAAIPAGLVAWHYAVQLSRPIWGHGSDKGRHRTPWILSGMCALALGTLAAVNATLLFAWSTGFALTLAIVAFSIIGAGVGMAGTSLLALLASETAPERRAAAAATTWIMMVAGIVISAGIAGANLEPYSEQRLALVASGVVSAALVVSALALLRLEPKGARRRHEAGAAEESGNFGEALREIMDDSDARLFTVFIFVSMLAYSMQDLILEPFAGLVFGMTPGESTQLSGLQHGGVLLGMIVTGVGGSAFSRRVSVDFKRWITLGCVGSALSLGGLATAAMVGPGWPLEVNIFVLGFCNGLFAVAAIGAMMSLAGAGTRAREGMRMGVWGASQAIAFGLGGLTGAVGVDLARRAQEHDGEAFQLIFAIEAGLFVAAALLALRATGAASRVRHDRKAREEAFQA